MTDSTQNTDPTDTQPGSQGWVPDIAEPAALLAALTQAAEARALAEETLRISESLVPLDMC